MRRAWLVAVWLIAGCDPDPFLCAGEAPGAPLPTPEEVCAHVEAIGCFTESPDAPTAFEDQSCEGGYADVRAQVPPEEFERIVRCYLAAEDCEDLEGCNRACGPDGGLISFDAGDGLPTYDAGPVDAGLGDDAGADGGVDAGPIDAGPTDAGLIDAGPNDAGPNDAGPIDAGPIDAGPMDAGPIDAGPPDAAPSDAGDAS